MYVHMYVTILVYLIVKHSSTVLNVFKCIILRWIRIFNEINGCKSYNLAYGIKTYKKTFQTCRDMKFYEVKYYRSNLGKNCCLDRE